MKSPILHIILAVVLCNTLTAQVEYNWFNKLNMIYYEANELLTIEHYNQNDLGILQFKAQDSSKTLPDYKIKELELEQKELQNNFGLSFNAAFNHNLGTTFNEENNEFVNTRYKAELEWQLLKNGFFKNKHNAKQLETKAALLALERNQKTIALWRKKFRLSYSYAINEELLELYSIRLKFVDQYFDILTELYSKKLIDREYIIKTGSNIETTKQEIANYKTLNNNIKDSIFPEFISCKLPFLVLKNNTLLLNSTRTKKDSLELASIANNYKWFEDISLSVYANQNWINATQNNRSYASVGLRLRVPLKRSFNKAKRRNDKHILTQQAASQSLVTQNQALTHYNGYREKLKDLKEQYSAWCIVKERKRKLQLIKSNVSDIQIGIKLMEALLDQFEILKNILHIKRQLYTSLSHLYELNAELQFSEHHFKEKNNTKVLVGLSEIFSKTHQIAFLKLKQIQRIYIENITDEFKNQLESEGFQIMKNTNKEECVNLEDWMLYEQNMIKEL